MRKHGLACEYVFSRFNPPLLKASPVTLESVAGSLDFSTDVSARNAHSTVHGNVRVLPATRAPRKARGRMFGLSSPVKGQAPLSGA